MDRGGSEHIMSHKDSQQWFRCGMHIYFVKINNIVCVTRQ